MNREEIEEILNDWFKMFDGEFGEDVQNVYNYIKSLWWGVSSGGG